MAKTNHRNVRLFFVLPSGCTTKNEAGDLMKMAYQEVKEANLSPTWLLEEQCVENAGAKNTIFVLQEFSGNIFERLRKTKSVRLCGPMAIRSCVAEGEPFPDNGSPVLTTAMRGVVLTASSLSPQDKKTIKEKVGFMGGIYSSNLIENVTHLVTNQVSSEKYLAANSRNIPVLKAEWVHEMLQKSQETNIRATDAEFLEKYKVPVFYNMIIACSNLPRKKKAELRKLIITNGGSYSEQLRQAETTLLVVEGTAGDKYRYAVSWQMPCVTPQYVSDSAKRGYALPFQDYLVKPQVKHSTPTKDDENPNFSYMTDAGVSIIGINTSKTSINDSQATILSSVGSQQGYIKKQLAGSKHSIILEKLTLEEAKKAGSFMDGCRIYLSGFTDIEGEKLKRILMRGGATMFSELTESVSHMLMGEFVSNDVKSMMALTHKPYAVTVDWVLASIKQRSPANEDLFLCLGSDKPAPEPPSPLSQKGLQLLTPFTPETAKMPPPAEPPVSRKLFSEFVKENVNKSPAKPVNTSIRQQLNHNNSTISNISSGESSVIPNIFQGLKMVVVGFPPEIATSIVSAVEDCGGSVETMNFSGIADYAIVPILPPTPNVTAVEVVTSLWVEDCLDSREVMAVQYYHQPLSVDLDKAPLADCCISLSSYSGKEKDFYVEFIQALGGRWQEVFARVAKADNGVAASTHLVCPKPEGQKYSAALRWGLPAVTKEWLHACAKQGSRVDITLYTVDGRNVSDMAKTPKVVPETPDVDQSKQLKTPETMPFLTTPVHVPPAKSTTFTKTTNLDGSKASTPTATKPAECTTPLNHPSVASLKRKSIALSSDEKSPFHVSTPDTPYGQFFGDPSPNTRKAWKKCIDNFPCTADPPPLKQPKRQSTPLTELMRAAWKGAVDVSDDSLNQDYSIEEMNDEPEESNQLTRQSSISQNLRESRRVTPGRGTPTLDDFKPYADKNKGNKKALKHSFSSLKLDSDKEKKSPANEKASEVLAELQKRLSVGRPSDSSEVRPLPQRELVCPEEQKSSTPKPENVWPESQPVYIGWDDPVESAERAKGRRESLPPKIIFSNVNDRANCEAVVKGLKQSGVCLAAEYDAQTTHLITDRPLRSEKLLCCIAAGKWVLHTSYVARLAETGGQPWPDEEEYEWGNEKAAGRLPVLAPNSVESELAHAAAHWRSRRARCGTGPFHGMRAVIVTSIIKVESLNRLIKAGAGEVLPSSSVLEATHCFVDAIQTAHIPGGMSALVTRQVPCLLPNFLADLLTKQPPPSAQEKLLPAYKKLMERNLNT